jgi:hypothetical protein
LAAEDRRALNRYTAPHSPLLHLRAHGDTLTLAATNGAEVAQLDLTGAGSDGRCAIPADTLVQALAATKPPRAADAAVVTLHDADARLHLSVNAGRCGTVSLNSCEPSEHALAPLAGAGPVVASGPVTALCDLLRKVGWAAGHDEQLAVIRLVRQPGAVLLVEATDRYRAHRANLGHPAPTPVDVRMPAAALTRATTLMTAHARGQQLTIDADPGLVRWHTPAVRLSAVTSHQPFPDLEPLREAVLRDAEVSFTVDRAALLTALNHAVTLTAGTRGASLLLEPSPSRGALDVVACNDTATEMHRARVPTADHHGPAHPLRFPHPPPRRRRVPRRGHRVRRRRNQPAAGPPALRRPPRDPRPDRPGLTTTPPPGHGDRARRQPPGRADCRRQTTAPGAAHPPVAGGPPAPPTARAVPTDQPPARQPSAAATPARRSDPPTHGSVRPLRTDPRHPGASGASDETGDR